MRLLYCSVPMCQRTDTAVLRPWLAGGLIATRQEIKQYPTRTNQIPRHIPPPHWASHPFVLFLAAGLLPFGTIFVELYFAMTSIWQVRCSCRGARVQLVAVDELCRLARRLVNSG